MKFYDDYTAEELIGLFGQPCGPPATEDDWLDPDSYYGTLELCYWGRLYIDFDDEYVLPGLEHITTEDELEAAYITALHDGNLVPCNRDRSSLAGLYYSRVRMHRERAARKRLQETPPAVEIGLDGSVTLAPHLPPGTVARPTEGRQRAWNNSQSMNNNANNALAMGLMYAQVESHHRHRHGRGHGGLFGLF